MMRALWIAVLACCASPIAAQEFTTLKGHGGPVMALAVSDAGQVASASFDNSVGLWLGETATWQEGHDAAVVSLDYSQAPALLSGGDDFRVLLWHPDLEQPIEVTKHLGKVSDIAVSPDANYIASAGWDGFVHLTTVVNLLQTTDTPPSDFVTTVLEGHQSNVTAVGFAPDDTLYSASSDGTLRIWERNTEGLRPRTIVRHGFGINVLIVEQDWIAYGAVDGGTRVIQPDTGAQIADLTLDRRPILALAYHAETAQLAVGDGHGYIMIVDTTRWQIARDFRAMRHGPVWALAFSPDGQTVYAGGLDDVVYAWPVALLDELESPDGSGQRSFLRDPETMPNGERQFMRKCSICHALTAGSSRKAGPSLYGVFGRRAGTLPDYRYSDTLDGSDIIWTETTIDALFDTGPDHYIPGSKMPMQVIARPEDRADLIAFLKSATTGDAK